MGAQISSLLVDRPNSDAELLNSFNTTDGLPLHSDVVVVGDTPSTITVLERSSSPGYKIGESTLTVFGLWLKQVGISSPLLHHLFGPKDGLAFYYFSSTGDPESYTNFIANGPPGDFVPTLQIERKVSELLLTLFAQRLGITVLHGHEAVIEDDTVNKTSEETVLKVLDKDTGKEESVGAKLLIDATGRFHRFVSKSKEVRIQRPKGSEGFNTHAFWGYFECDVDEKEIPLRDYESVNTNHICVPEGWAWVIRLPTWEGSPLPNLINMINHLLDLNAANTPADAYPSTAELVKRFDLKFRWVISVGFALRSDVACPSDLAEFGNCEAEQKFNWVVSKYKKVSDFMSNFALIHDLYGPGTTWYVRKNLAFKSPRVTGPNWMAIGDATGFTNPLYSPGINANMVTSIFAAEMTKQYLDSDSQKKELRDKYEMFCKDRVTNLQRMNVFNYVLMRDPALGPIGPLWQYLIGTGNANFQGAKKYTLKDCHELLTTWDWGANEVEYIAFAKKICQLLEGPADSPLSTETIEEVQRVSAEGLKDAIATGKYTGRWGGLFRYYDDNLVFNKEKRERDVLAKRCEDCGEWQMLRPDMLKCVFCGAEHAVEESTKILWTS
ncbi:uncharacterized protein PAC_20033 [Phialocephala subalpina]|uniref:Uncharacterized protein n=1 Tax=Phialocephala subalpina TaxID=576137 RepID=A0A1L7XYI3_9HELO|nr:uncharacterized protein PAC_20033 [Phialocephala subalpina]